MSDAVELTCNGLNEISLLCSCTAQSSCRHLPCRTDQSYTLKARSVKIIGKPAVKFNFIIDGNVQ